MPVKKIKNKLKQALLLRKMEQKELADILDVPRSRISKIASGMNIKLDMALRICEALNLNLNDIFYTKPLPITTKAQKIISKKQNEISA